MYSGLYGYDKGNKSSLFSSKRIKKTDIGQLLYIGLGALSVVLFVVVVYQGNRISIFSAQNQHLEREIQNLRRESSSLRASLNNQQQEVQSVNRELRVSKTAIETMRSEMSRKDTMKENLQSEMQIIHKDLRTCEINAKQREEELEAQVAKLAQEKNDLQIRVDTEHGMSISWAKQLAETKKSLGDCENRLKWFINKPSDDKEGVGHDELVKSDSAENEGVGQTEVNTAEVDSAVKIEGNEGIGTIEVEDEVNLGRKAGDAEREISDDPKRHRMEIE